MNKEQLEEEVKKFEWMHSIDLENGIITPGKWPRNPHIEKAFDKINFEEKKVLDIGTCNGLWSFEAEKRGASEVYSIDYLIHDNYWCTPAYRFAHDTLQSKAIYNPDVDVYDIEKLGITDFDVIIFCGVYYHLKNPLLALSKIRKILKTGGHVIIEGPIINDDSKPIAGFLYKEIENKDNYFGSWHRSNWWVPSGRCLREWVECSLFDIIDEFSGTDPSYLNSNWYKLKSFIKKILNKEKPHIKRTVLLAKGVKRADKNYSSKQADSDLIDFFL
ncbi:DUF1698 domain-containing protein [Nitrosococcus wardiae]|uniref:DUF1698 domain-containing protein n=1 Tax=Nitrosococcus wardiae TaxID=1814290 RepID=A0A4P7BWN6_9GAMM|nr:DUF1698 domain-containing protein [Nitrosococcus wardiae]QBQ54508.1 DUF1698 domain-containing protein [Nitrosococcus wardiae]